MNAYELADRLDLEPYGIYGEQAANTLRQQADRIKDLTMKLNVKAIQVSELERKQQSAEPVAWWTGKFEDESEDFMFTKTRQAHINHPQSVTHKFFPIPLYTTPQTKPLSDEEMEEVIRKHWNKKYGNRNMLTLCKAVLEEANK